MRLDNVSHGHTFGKRMLLRVIRIVSRMEAPDVVKTLFYRPAFFGAAHSAHTQAAMRGPSAWSVGERELFAAFVSRLNQCHF